jgi:hypothetical protein
MTVRKMTVKKIIALENDRFKETIMVKYDRKKNVRIKKKKFEKKDNKKKYNVL